MLSKLLKYDLKWIYKVVAVFYLLAIIFSVLGRALHGIKNSVIFSVVTQICFGIAISMMVSSLINCVMRLWVRFIKNCYKDESYLTHTLPVEKKTIYVSKVISAFISIFTTTIVILLCLAICYYSETNIQVLKSILELAASTYDTTMMNIVLLVSIIMTMQIIFIVLIGYAGIILGHKSNKNKMVNTILIGFAFYMLTQIVSLFIVGIIGLFNANIMNLINTTEMIQIEAIKFLLYGAMGIYCIYIIFYYILGKKAFERGVNVE